mmetsp:Transcript_10979/g.15111  ORF Transcript_10979/g.15111 Transcript_10979/m.15111 type:complete len:84 (+) Transcript_10979:674-925(+)
MQRNPSTGLYALNRRLLPPSQEPASIGVGVQRTTNGISIYIHILKFLEFSSSTSVKELALIEVNIAECGLASLEGKKRDPPTR